MTTQIKAPMVNVNEDEIELIEWHKSKDQFIKKGELLATFETTKSTYEFSSPDTGYFTPLIESGTTIQVGQPIGYLSKEIGAPLDETEQKQQQGEPLKPNKITWTRKAVLLAQRNNISQSSIEKFTNSTNVTEQIVLTFLSQQKPISTITPRNTFSNTVERVLILGGGNVAALVIDILNRLPHQKPVAILDDNPDIHGTHVLGVPVLGTFEEIQNLFDQKLFDAAALAVGLLPARQNIFLELTKKGIPFTNIIDPSAIIGVNASMGTGNIIMAFCRLGPDLLIGDNNFLSAYVNIEHHNQMGSHCTFGPNVMMSGGVQIGNSVRFGTGIAIEPRLTIGDNATIASGVTLTTSVPANTLVKGKTNFSF
jgi:sugar O-acyltransferase (sialic acid O-acetyltransferase NeuD family)